MLGAAGWYTAGSSIWGIMIFWGGREHRLLQLLLKILLKSEGAGLRRGCEGCKYQSTGGRREGDINLGYSPELRWSTAY